MVQLFYVELGEVCQCAGAEFIAYRKPETKSEIALGEMREPP